MLEDVKCAGIIVETELTEKNSLSWVGVGIGVNITSAPHGIATSLDKHSSKAFGLPAFRTAFLTNMDKYYTLWAKEGFGPIRQKWLEYAHQKGSRMRVRVGPQIEEGIFFGIDDEGGLLLEGKNQRIKKITAGEIYL
jgi:BirA family biotin operon repressor/biotin-[acetyl-CoA-carboxylase] ligase